MEDGANHQLPLGIWPMIIMDGVERKQRKFKENLHQLVTVAQQNSLLCKQNVLAPPTLVPATVRGVPPRHRLRSLLHQFPIHNLRTTLLINHLTPRYGDAL
jgi:hypothetical protein